MADGHPKVVLFDLLTALLDSWTLWNKTAGSEEHGRRWRAKYLELTYQCGMYQSYEDLMQQASDAVGLPRSAPVTLLARWDELKPWPEAPGVLQKLQSQAVKIGVVTNCSTELGRRAAATCGVTFDVVVTAEEAGFYKPRIETYTAALRVLGIGAGDVLFVAGSSADVPGASMAGMQVVWHNRVQLVPLPGSTSPMREGRTLEEALQNFI
jgi:2-haloalkanoic acid dehalogenase type II